MQSMGRGWGAAVVGVAVALGLTVVAQGPPVTTPFPILFVTQVPVPQDFTTVGAVFGNHRASLDAVARGGDLWIRYPDGSLKNLTAAAGFGATGLQGSSAIAVREPSVHWSGTRAVFSMVIGGADQRYQSSPGWRWQLYEISGLGPTDTPVITKVPRQPTTYNNVSPIYGTDDRILFTSDRPRGGEAHLYPQLDEYEEAPVVSGIWSLDPATGDLFLVQHSPSGSFSPQVDSFGRLVYIRWDHLQRDQQADADSRASTAYGTYGTFNYADESASAARLSARTEVFPEPRSTRADLLAGTNLVGHSFNDFFPWMVEEDGSGEETLNHVGRHEFLGYFDASFNDDPNLTYHHSQSPRLNTNTIGGFIQIKESPSAPGTYFGVDAPEFSTHAAGQIISTVAPPSRNPDAMTITYVTHRATSSYTDTPPPEHSGLYRNPLPLSDGRLMSVHTPETRRDQNTGTTATPGSRYDFRLTMLTQVNGVFVPDVRLTPGISKSITYWSPDVLVTYSGPLWELDPVEVRPRTRPARRTTPLPPEEQEVLDDQGISAGRLEAWLAANDLALIVSHDVTTRDHSDRQQPFNLRVAGGGVQTIGAPGKIYDVAFLQIVQADQLRGIGGTSAPRPGRRVLGQFLHDPAARNPVVPGAPAGSVAIAPDGSVAAFVPARRALSWQLTDAAGVPVVRERLWITMRPGEVRVCKSCHGVNTTDQAQHGPPTKVPQALRQLLAYWAQELEGGGGGTPPVTLTVMRAGAGSGVVASSPAGIACGASCTATVQPGTSLTLSATPAAGSRFAGWSGDGCSGVATCTLSPASSRTVTATFVTDPSTPATFTRYLAEGVASAFFDTSLVLANPGARPATVSLQFLRDDGVIVTDAVVVPALASRTVKAGLVEGLAGHAFGTVVTSDVEIAVDRTVSWHDAAGVTYGAHAETSIAGPASRWYLAEGATHSGFDLFYLLQNPSASAVDVRVRYLRPVGPPLEKTYVVPARTRINIWVDQEVFGASGARLLADTDVSAVVDAPGGGVIVERAMYYTPAGQVFRAGHESAGVTSAATAWYLAEGATGPFFDLFLLIANPTDAAADVAVTYLLPDGRTERHEHRVQAQQRYTIWVDQAGPSLADTAVSMVVASTNGVPIVVERSMWWPGDSRAWTEAHNAPGATVTGTAWAVADGEVTGAPLNRATYYLVANPGATDAQVKVTLLFADGTAALARTFPVAAHSRFGVSARDAFPDAIGKRFGALIESVGASPIVVERAMYADGGGEVWAAGTNALATRLR